MEAQTLQRIEQLVLESANANDLGTFIPARLYDGAIINLEHLQPGRSRYRGTFKTSVLSEFVTYLKANTGGAGFIDHKACTANVLLNLGTPAQPGHGDWRAALALEPLAPYAAVTGVDGFRFSQKGLVEWMEDWSGNLTADEGGEFDVTGAVAAIRRLKISAKSDVTHTDKDFGASRSSLEDVEASAEGGLPNSLYFSCEPYAGFRLRTIRLRLSVLTSEKPEFVLRIVARPVLEEAIAIEFKERLLSQAGDVATLTIGSFTP